MEEGVKLSIQTTLFKLGFLKEKNPNLDDLKQALFAFQQFRGLPITGEINSETLIALEESHWSLGDRVLNFQPNNFMRGDDVAFLQSRLVEMGFQVGKVDGIYGVNTREAVVEFQKSVGAKSDGICGPATVLALLRLVKTVSGGLPTQLRDEIKRAKSGPALVNKTIVIDPQIFPEEQYLYDVATRLEGRLIALGVNVIVTRGASTQVDLISRIDIANKSQADLVISLALDKYLNDSASGFATFYYGNDLHGAHSVVGEKFANLINREMLARTDLVNCGSHAKTWDLLRLTKSPTVQLDLGYLSNPNDMKKLSSPEFREAVAEALIISIQRLYLDSENDAKTGTLRLEDLRKLGLRK
mgnify:CR=1 FL=1